MVFGKLDSYPFYFRSNVHFEFLMSLDLSRWLIMNYPATTALKLKKKLKWIKQKRSLHCNSSGQVSPTLCLGVSGIWWRRVLRWPYYSWGLESEKGVHSLMCMQCRLQLKIVFRKKIWIFGQKIPLSLLNAAEHQVQQSGHVRGPGLILVVDTI